MLYNMIHGFVPDVVCPAMHLHPVTTQTKGGRERRHDLKSSSTVAHRDHRKCF